ncbi:MAG: alpha-2-macroglobulin family protein [Acidiphilium sp.]
MRDRSFGQMISHARIGIAAMLVILASLTPTALASAPPTTPTATATKTVDPHAPWNNPRILIFINQTLPGLGSDASLLRFDLTQPNIALTASAQAHRAHAEAAMDQALHAKNWRALRDAAIRRIGLGAAAKPRLWLDYGTAMLNLHDGEAQAALEAGYLAFTLRNDSDNPATTTRIALEIMRRALARRGDHLAEIGLLGQIVQAYPTDAQARTLLNQKVQRYGFTARKITTHAESFPASACIAFTIPLPRGGNRHPGDYVTVTPSRHSLAVTENQGQLCITGLRPGTTSTVTLHPGLHGIAGTTLTKPLTIKVSLTNRQPALIADPNHYIIPASNPPAIGFASINLSKVKVKITHVAERSLLNFINNHPLLNPNGFSSSLYGNNSPIIFTGTANIPAFRRNQLIHTVLPLANVMKKPGLYAVALSPADGTPNNGTLSLVQIVLRTNIAPTTWRGRDGLHVQLRRYTNARAISGATINLIAADNAILGTAKTNDDGIAFFPAPLLAGPGGQAPAALHITDDSGDFTLVDLNASPFDLSDRGVSGRPEPKPIDPYIYVDRGIYRPGETIHLTALLRNPNGKPLNVPLHLIVRRPGGQIFSDTVPRWSDDGAFTQPIRLSPGAQAGTWSITLAVNDHANPLAERDVTIAAFVPERLAVALGKPTELTPNAIDPWPVHVRFLYGAPGANLTGTASVKITQNPTPFPAFKDYQFGLQGEIFGSPLRTPKLPETNATGASAVPIDLTHLPDSTHALQAKLTVTINDPSGRAVGSALTIPIRPTTPLIGLKPDFTGGAVDQGVKPAFDLVAVNPAGQPIAMKLDVALVRQDYEWGIIWNQSVARWRFTYINRPVLKQTISIPAGQPYHLVLPTLPYGRYRLRVIQHEGGLAATSTIFYSGWITASNPGVPTRLTVMRDKRRYLPGETAHLHITAPYGGRATLVIANNRVLATRNFTLPARGRDISVPISAKWGAGAYAIVHVFRPADKTSAPDRAIGLTWLGLKPGKRQLPLTFAVKKLYRPGRDVTFTINTKPGAYVTLAAVDEGILRLTDFVSPNPLGHYFGKRTLGVDINDSYAALLRLPTGQSTALHVGGGGDFGAAAAPIPQKIVSLFAGPVQANSDGVAKITLHIPDFNGQIRLMAVGWKHRAVGSASTDIITRHKIIADLLLPRFLSPGDHADIGIMLQNLDLPAGRFHITLTSTGAIAGNADAQFNLTPQRRLIMPATLTANAIGTGTLHLRVTGPNGYTQSRTRQISVHVVRAPSTILTSTMIGGGDSVKLSPDLTPFITGSAQADLTLGNHLPFDPTAYLQALHAITYHFLEISVSQGMPLTALHGKAAGPDPTGRLAKAVENVLDDQRYDGAFGLWSSQDDAQPWLTAYATEFLLRARQAGADVPQAPLASALDWLRSEVVNNPAPTQADIYAAYVLALDHKAPAGAIRVMDNQLSAVSHPLARAQLGAALALIGEPDEARAALQAALKIHNRGGYFWWRSQDWMAGYGTPLRDAWAVPTIIRETGLLRAQYPTLAANLPGQGVDIASLNPQELGDAGLAAGIFAGHPTMLTLTLNGKAIAPTTSLTRPISQPITVANGSKKPVPATIAVTGIPAQAPGATSKGMSLHEAFYTPDGQPLDISALTQNTVFVMVVSGRATDSAPHHVILTIGLPAGWELAGNISSGKASVAAMPWLHQLTPPDAIAAEDDRSMAAFTLFPPCSDIRTCEDNGHDQEFRTAIMLRAVTKGRFTLPGASLVDVYHPLIRSTLADQSITVLAPSAAPPSAP